MLDKVIVVSRHQAYMIFDDRSPVSISSDIDVVPFLLWFLGHPAAHLVVNGETVTGIELRVYNDEITQKIVIAA